MPKRLWYAPVFEEQSSERDKWGQHKWGYCKFSCLTEGLFGVLFPKVPGRTFFLNLSKFITFAAAPLVLTPFVRSQPQAKCAELAEAEAALRDMKTSFADKVKQAKEVEEGREAKMRNRGALAQHRTTPHMANLNEDMQLSCKLRYYFREGQASVIGQPGGLGETDSESDEGSSSGRSGSGGSSRGSSRAASSRGSSAGSEEGEALDVVLVGEDIRQRHATVTNTDGNCTLSSRGCAAEWTFVNGQSLAKLVRARRRGSVVDAAPCHQQEGVVLEHGDRLAFGNRCLYFVFVKPAEGYAEQLIMTGEVSYAMARQELLRAFHRQHPGLRGLFRGPHGESIQGRFDSDDESDDSLIAGGRGGRAAFCACCPRLRDELAARDREVLQLRGELLEARSAPQPRGRPVPETPGVATVSLQEIQI